MWKRAKRTVPEFVLAIVERALKPDGRPRLAEMMKAVEMWAEYASVPLEDSTDGGSPNKRSLSASGSVTGVDIKKRKVEEN